MDYYPISFTIIKNSRGDIISQLRQYVRYCWICRLRVLILKGKLGFIGKRVIIEKNVTLLRFLCNIRIEDDVILKEGTRICSCNEKAKISIGEKTTIGYHTHIFASEEISIGNDCLIAPFVYIVDSDHGIIKGKKINEQSNNTSPISIGNDVWIATHSIILKGVSIGDGSIIAANSVVIHDIPPNSIFGGSPAKKIGERTNE